MELLSVLRISLSLRDPFSKPVLENDPFVPHDPLPFLEAWFPGIPPQMSVTLALHYPNRALCGFWPRIP